MDVHNYEKLLRKFTDDGNEHNTDNNSNSAANGDDEQSMLRKQSHEYIDNRQQSLKCNRKAFRSAGENRGEIDINRHVPSRSAVSKEIQSVHHGGAKSRKHEHVLECS